MKTFEIKGQTVHFVPWALRPNSLALLCELPILPQNGPQLEAELEPPAASSSCPVPPGRLCRLKKKAQGEVNATAISNLLPFMEYELHTQLMNKLKLRGMNALFGLRVQISVGENMLVGLAVSRSWGQGSGGRHHGVLLHVGTFLFPCS